MEKMVGVYQQNPSLGDPNTIQQQLNENGKELDTVNVELHKFQVKYRYDKVECITRLGNV